MSTLDDLIAEQVLRYKERLALRSASEKPKEAEDVFAEVERAEAETLPAQEVLPEQETAPETPEAVVRAAVETEQVRSQLPTTNYQLPTPRPPKDRLLQDIESAMQENLEDLYKQLPPARQKLFRSRGEQAARAIRAILTSVHANVKKIFQILFDWLKTLTGVNRFYLEQEAKIKTDKILAAAEEERRRGTLT